MMTFINPLHRLSSLQAVDHVPDAVGLAAFDDLEWGGIVKGRIRCLEPLTDVARFHDIGQGIE